VGKRKLETPGKRKEEVKRRVPRVGHEPVSDIENTKDIAPGFQQ